MYPDKNITRQKSMQFAVRIYNLCKYLMSEHNERVLSKQLLRSGTSIGANLAEARCAMSDGDFLAKVYIAYKECSETLYWIELLKSTELISTAMFDSIYTDCEELLKLLTSTIKKQKQKIKK